MTATVRYEGTGCFLVLADDTRGWTQSTAQTANYQNALAEVIAGAPTSPSGSPETLAPVGRVTFTVTQPGWPDKGHRGVEDWSLLNAQCRAPGPRFWVIPWYYGGSQLGSVVGRLARSCWLASVA
jgi:hypothetical protein